MKAASALLAIASVAGITAAQPAEAAGTGYVYIAMPTWAGNCPNGGSVKGVHAAVDALWSTPARGDWGDDLVYAKVRMGSSSTVSVKPFCSRSWWRGGSYWGPASQQVIKATRHGQTFWVGPLGKWSN